MICVNISEGTGGVFKLSIVAEDARATVNLLKDGQNDNGHDQTPETF